MKNVDRLSKDYQNLLDAIREVFREELSAAGDSRADSIGDEFLTHKEAMGILKVSYMTLYNYRKKGIIKGVKVRQKYYYRRSDVSALMEGKRSKKRY